MVGVTQRNSLLNCMCLIRLVSPSRRRNYFPERIKNTQDLFSFSQTTKSPISLGLYYLECMALLIWHLFLLTVSFVRCQIRFACVMNGALDTGPRFVMLLYRKAFELPQNIESVTLQFMHLSKHCFTTVQG